MTIEIKVPVLGKSITEATVGRWFKKPGEAVKADEPLVELETDKVTVEVPAPAAGVLGDILAVQGATVAIGSLLGALNEGGAVSAPAPIPALAATLPPQKAPCALKTGCDCKTSNGESAIRGIRATASSRRAQGARRSADRTRRGRRVRPTRTGFYEGRCRRGGCGEKAGSCTDAGASTGATGEPVNAGTGSDPGTAGAYNHGRARP